MTEIKNYKLTLAYDGTDFVGWQRQSRAVANSRSVQGVLEAKLSELLGQPISIAGSGRTDAGVHALEQVASFRAATSLPTANLPVALNGRLPSDLRILSCEEAAEDFHARFSAIGKTYEYYLTSRTPSTVFNHRYFYACELKLDFELMQRAAAIFVGTHNLLSFTAMGGSAQTFERDIYACRLEPAGSDCGLPWQLPSGLWRLSITGSGFLYKTVRLIMGGLIAVGSGRLELDRLRQALNEPGEHPAATAPAHGLYMKRVYYDPEVLAATISGNAEQAEGQADGRV